MPDISSTDRSPSGTLQADLLPAEAAVRAASAHTAANGLRYSTFGLLDATHTAPAELARLTGTVPAALTSALADRVYAFVPLALSVARLAGDDTTDDAFSPSDKTVIAARATPDLEDKATCHRNSSIDGAEHVFLSARLHPDRFALAFEFFINIAHNFVDAAGGLPASFTDAVWSQALAGVRGETSIDAWEHRADALGQPPTPTPTHSRRPSEPGRFATGMGTFTSGPDTLSAKPASSSGNSGDASHEIKLAYPAAPLAGSGKGSPSAAAIDEKARTAYLETAFSDTLAIYLLSLYLDFDYTDLRERDYPLLAPAALAERLRLTAKLFPPNPGYDFAIRYRRKG